MNDNLSLRSINSQDTYPFRKLIKNSAYCETLQKDITEDTFEYEGDFNEETFHLGVFKTGKLASVASFYQNSHPSFEDPIQYQIRAFVTAKGQNRRGIGKYLLKAAENQLKLNQVKLVWCRATDKTKEFFLKSGYEVHSGSFEDQSGVERFILYKRI